MRDLKNDLIAIRISPTDRALLEAAAKAEEITPTDIARRGMMREARRVLTTAISIEASA